MYFYLTRNPKNKSELFTFRVLLDKLVLGYDWSLSLQKRRENKDNEIFIKELLYSWKAVFYKFYLVRSWILCPNCNNYTAFVLL